MDPDIEHFEPTGIGRGELVPITSAAAMPHRFQGWGDGGYPHSPREVHNILVDTITAVTEAANLLKTERGESSLSARYTAGIRSCEGYRANYYMAVYTSLSVTQTQS